MASFWGLECKSFQDRPLIVWKSWKFSFLGGDGAPLHILRFFKFLQMFCEQSKNSKIPWNPWVWYFCDCGRKCSEIRKTCTVHVLLVIRMSYRRLLQCRFIKKNLCRWNLPKMTSFQGLECKSFQERPLLVWPNPWHLWATRAIYLSFYKQTCQPESRVQSPETPTPPPLPSGGVPGGPTG